MKIAYLPEFDESGSVWKYRRMLQATGHEVTDTLNGADLAFVQGSVHTNWRRCAIEGVPYVVMQHDTHSLFAPDASPESVETERRMLEGAAGVVFNTEAQRDYCCGRYAVRAPIVLHLKVLTRDMPPMPKTKLEGRNIVHAGSTVSSRADRYHYYQMHDTFARLISDGWTVHVYSRSSQSQARHELKAIGCVIHETLPYDDLLREMGRYQAGVLAVPHENAHTATAIPNRTYDYLAAGIPTYCIGDTPGSRLAVDGGWASFDQDALPKVIHAMRKAQSADAYIPVLTAWLDTLDLSRPKVPVRCGLAYNGQPVGHRQKYQAMLTEVCMSAPVVGWDDAATCDCLLVEGDKRRDYLKAKGMGIPYVLAEIDVASMRDPSCKRNEAEMVAGAAAILLTSEDHEAYLRAVYGELPPTEVVHLRPTAAMLDFDPLPKLPGRNIVYQGGVVPPHMADGEYGYRAYHDVFRALQGCGWTVHVYPAFYHEPGPEYAKMGCIVHKRVKPGALLRELSQYQAGFQGYATSGTGQAYVESCRPNKTWEYLAAGIPTLGYNTGRTGAIYDGRWGVVAASLDDLPEASERVLEIRITDAMRLAQVMDADLDAFRRLAAVAALAERRKPVARQRKLMYPVKLAHDCRLGAATYRAGTRVDRKTALALKAAGQLHDPRIQ